MYCKYYGFSEDPFQLTPDPSFLYLDEVYREALAHLEYGVNTGKGYVLLTGEVGTGKTTIVHSFLEKHRLELITAFVFSTTMSFVELLKLVHEDFDTGAEGDSEAFLLIELNRFLLKKYHEGAKTVLILDEAQNLSEEMLEKVRMLSNLESRKAKLLQTVLVGQPELAAKLERPSLRQLRQRVAVRFDIPPMTEERTLRYIEHRLRVVGAPNRGLFTEEALRRIHVETSGIPRMVNVICSNALLLGFGAGNSLIDEALVREVVADLRRGVPAAPSPEPAPEAAQEDARLHASIDRAPRNVAIALPAAAESGSPMTAEEAAAYLRVSTKTARHLLRRGSIPASKVGRGWRVFRADLDAYVRSREGRPRAALAPAGAIPGEGNPDREEGA
ncbi:MAG: AAA family ATPase [Candidatus Eisenbacteria bacterium]|nr:AAA family ATPase [Candidatus Eisenbacteria bacterium]